ncbi:hypothetical protein ABZ366_24095 [Streptomyces sp. NPDC005904]|uniref:hypothetical protein n=1 Tax=Streptomyces sp. NPDC005904 TaxID=3154570 RepID=UPI0033C09D51
MSLPQHVCTLSGIPRSAGEARDALVAFLDGADEYTPSRRVDALLALSELVADAEQNSAGIRNLTVRTYQNTLELTLEYRPGARTAPHAGLGWNIVSAVARAVTLTTPRDTGGRARVLMDLA